MIELMKPDFQTGERTAVLGAKMRSGNIGEAVANHLYQKGHSVGVDDCYVPIPDTYGPPQEGELARFDNLVITLGQTSLTPIREVGEGAIMEVIYGSLVLPLLCVRQYVQDRRSDVYNPATGPVGIGGRIVLFGSYAHDHVLTGCAAYCAAKAGLAHAVRTLAWELTPEFLISIIHPYHVPSTPMGGKVLEGMVNERGMTVDEAKAYQRKDLKLDHHLRPDEIAHYVGWLLAAPEAAWMSGQGLNLYGGVR